MPITKILLANDGSEGAFKALGTAISLAKHFGAELLELRIDARELRHLRAAERARHALREPDHDALTATELLQSDGRSLRGRQPECWRRLPNDDAGHVS